MKGVLPTRSPKGRTIVAYHCRACGAVGLCEAHLCEGKSETIRISPDASFGDIYRAFGLPVPVYLRNGSTGECAFCEHPYHGMRTCDRWRSGTHLGCECPGSDPAPGHEVPA